MVEVVVGPAFGKRWPERSEGRCPRCRHLRWHVSGSVVGGGVDERFQTGEAE